MLKAINTPRGILAVAEVKKVRVTMKDGRVFAGFVLPKTDFSHDDVILLKLENGYNVGLASKDIRKREFLKGKAPIMGVPRTELKGRGPLVSVLGTGGTIASRVDYLTGGVKASMTAAEIFGAMPEAAEHAQLRFTNLMSKLSEDMVPKNWAAIAAETHKLLKNSEGVVVLHGTDTMHYTASAVSFMLDTPKPVVFTGAQRSSDRPSSDAYGNVLASIQAAKSDIGEVVVCLHASMSDSYNYVIRGNRALKAHSSARWAFKSVNYPPLAKVWPDGKLEKVGEYFPRRKGGSKLENKFEPRVALVKVFPGASPDVLRHYASLGYKGIVLEGTGLGHVPVNPDNNRSWIPVIKELEDDMVFVVTSQTCSGRTHKNVYTNLRKLSRLGVLFGGDMLPETAYTKLVWALGNFSKNTTRKIMETNVRGELNARTTLANYEGSIE